MSKRSGQRRGKSKLNGRVIGILVAVLIVGGLASVWARDYLPVRDNPGTRIYITANQAMKWLEDKPVAFLQLSFPECPSCQAADRKSVV